MENASKALTIAGGVLIGVLLISLLVAFFNNLRSYQKVKDDEENFKQSIVSNSDYEKYLKTIYGSELLSLINMVNDYNARKSDDKNYTKIDIEVIFRKNNNYTIGSTTYGFSKNKKYNQQDFENIMNAIESKKDSNSYIRGIDETLRKTQFQLNGKESYDSNGIINKIKYIQMDV